VKGRPRSEKLRLVCSANARISRFPTSGASVAGRGGHRGLEPGGVPGDGLLAPLGVGRGGAEQAEELLVADVLAVAAGVLEEVVGQVDARPGGLGVVLADVVGIAAQDGRLHAPGVDHVIRDEQELLAADPVLLDADGLKALVGAGPGVVLEEQIEDGHEVGLARAETAEELGGLAAPGVEGRLDEAQGVVEGVGELGGDHVVGQRPLGLARGDPFGEVQDEVAPVDLIGKVEQLADQPFHHSAFRLGRIKLF
jgi:hypothetical protein